MYKYCINYPLKWYFSKNAPMDPPQKSASDEGRAQDFPTELRPWNAFWPGLFCALPLQRAAPAGAETPHGNRKPHDRSYEQNGSMDR